MVKLCITCEYKHLQHERDKGTKFKLLVPMGREEEEWGWDYKLRVFSCISNNSHYIK